MWRDEVNEVLHVEQLSRMGVFYMVILITTVALVLAKLTGVLAATWWVVFIPALSVAISVAIVYAAVLSWAIAIDVLDWFCRTLGMIFNHP